MKNYIFYMIILVLVYACNSDATITDQQAESFMKFYGESFADRGNDVVQLSDGGYVLVGTVTNEATVKKMLVIKTDEFGNIDWTDTLTATEVGANTYGSQVALETDDEFAVIGKKELSQNDADLVFRKYNKNTGLVSENVLNSSVYDECLAMEKCAGGYILAGYTATDYSNENTKDVLWIKLDTEGNLLWRKTRSAAEASEQFNSVAERENGYFIFVGSSNYSGHAEEGQENTNILLVETTADGNELLKKTWGGTNSDFGIDVKKVAENQFLVLAHTNNTQSGNGTDLYTFRIGANILSKQDSILIATSGNQLASSLSVRDNAYIIGGTDAIGTGSTDIKIWKCSLADNSIIYERSFGLDEISDEGPHIQITSDNGCIITGSVGYENNWMISLIKLKENGDL